MLHRIGAPLFAILSCTLLTLSCEKQEQERPSTPLVDAARNQIGITVKYDPAYEKLSYPGGDVPKERGVCTDVVIRAMRDALNFDLQEAVHLDMKANFQLYPPLWGLTSTDRNIDHRRVPNLQTFFERKGWKLELTKDPKHYQAGDLVTCTVPSGRPHIMIVSNRTNSKGVPLIIHNLGSGTKEENQLFTFKLTGHYRIAE